METTKKRSNIAEHNKSLENGRRNNVRPSKEEQIQRMRNFFNPETFPKGFENWSQEEQDDYFEQKLSNYLPNGMPKFICKMFVGMYHNTHSGNIPSELPEWVDADKIRRGQQCARKKFLQISLNVIVGYVMLLSFQSFAQPIQMTRKSYTPYTTFLRFFNTMSAVRKVIDEDALKKGSLGRASAEKGRKMHGLVNNMYRQKTVVELNELCRIKKPWSTAKDVLLEDFREVIPELEIDYRIYAYDCNMPWGARGITQSTIAFTVIVSVGLAIENPKFFGIHDMTEQDADDVCHLTRLLLYYLGIDDKFNFYGGTVPEIRQRVRDGVKYLIKPNLREINETWEHMMRCLAVGASYYVPHISFETYVLFAADYMDIPMKNFRASIGFIERARYRIVRFLIDHLMKWPLVSRIANKIFDYLMKRTMSFGPKKLAELEEHSNKMLSAASVIL